MPVCRDVLYGRLCRASAEQPALAFTAAALCLGLTVGQDHRHLALAIIRLSSSAFPVQTWTVATEP
jgi:hypothetical protein